jgi:predicted secreted protein
MSRNTVALASLLSLLVLFSFASAGLREEIAEVDYRPTACGLICLDEYDNGQTIHLRRGELVLVRLRSNPSTGNNWHLEELDTDVVLPLCRAFVPDNPDLLGSPGDLKWFFQAESRGETDLILKYYRIWEGPHSASRTLRLRFVVH